MLQQRETRQREVREYSIIGKRLPRVDAAEKVTGTALYTVDMSLPHMLYGKILRSPYPHARIVHIDTSQAEKLPGVKAIVTAQDAPPIKYGGEIRNAQIFGGGKVRYIGDEVAAVAAIDEDLAEEALELILVEYEELPAVFDPEEALQPGAPRIHEDAENNVAGEVNINRGDIDRGFKEADVIVEDDFKIAAVVNCSMEPLGCLASFDASGKLTLYTGNSFPSGLRSGLARVLELPVGKVRVVQYHVGGAFGGRAGLFALHAICTLLAKKSGRPVKTVNTREEEFLLTRHRVPAKIRLKLGARKDGMLTAEYGKIVADCGAYAFQGPTILVSMPTRNDGVYRLSNVKWECKSVYTNKTPVGACRSFGNSQLTFARESLMDMLAEKLGMDILNLKLKNALRTGDVSVHGWILNSCGLTECLHKTAESFGWKQKKAARQAGWGVGVASMVHESDMRRGNGFFGSVAFVKVLEDGKVNVVVGEAEYGQGAHTTYAMVAAEELGIPWGDVLVSPIDTDVTPFALGPFGSKLTITGGSAVKLAAQDAKRQLLEVASQMLGVKAEKLETKEQKVWVRGNPQKSVSYAQVAQTAISCRGGSAIVGKGVDERHTDDCLSLSHPTHYGNPCSAYYFDTVMAEVEVNTRTGQVKVVKVTVADDCGRALNLSGLEGQIQGGLAMGTGATFTEERICWQGQVANPDFSNYKIPTSLDVPPVAMIMVESNEPSGPFGAKAGGESAAINSLSPAIANAIYDATGVRVKELPITPDRLLRALAEHKRK